VSQVQLVAELRSDFGKGAARRLRRAGQVPAVVYGAGSELLHVAVNAHELGQAIRHAGTVIEITGAGKGQKVVAREIQRDPVTNTIEHVDLVVVK
jgi:large subunit ribosomal protein L25